MYIYILGIVYRTYIYIRLSYIYIYIYITSGVSRRERICPLMIFKILQAMHSNIVTKQVFQEVCNFQIMYKGELSNRFHIVATRY